MKRRGKMTFRAACWTLGALLGFVADLWAGGNPHLDRYIMFWTGMMLAAFFVHLDPPEVTTWKRSA